MNGRHFSVLSAPCAAVLAIALAGCATAPPVVAEPARPAFVDALIAEFTAAPVANPPASIWRYTYRGQPVWFVPSKCCDFPSQLYDVRGDEICQPDGGFSGRGDGRCPDFFEARRDDALVWRDPRG